MGDVQIVREWDASRHAFVTKAGESGGILLSVTVTVTPSQILHLSDTPVALVQVVPARIIIPLAVVGVSSTGDPYTFGTVGLRVNAITFGVDGVTYLLQNEDASAAYMYFQGGDVLAPVTALAGMPLEFFAADANPEGGSKEITFTTAYLLVDAS